MDIVIDDKNFSFSNESTVTAKRYDLDIVEPDFNKSTEVWKHQFINKKIKLPDNIESQITRTSLLPCSKIYEDNLGKKRLNAYFD